jgi:transcriptional regulator with XRE-family HTH domain
MHLNIKTIREIRNYSQNFMARKLNMTQGNYSRIENGRTTLSGNMLIKISKILDVEINDLVNLNESTIIKILKSKQVVIQELKK